MSLRRETTDGGFPGGGLGTPQRGNTVPNQGKNGKPAFTKRTGTRARIGVDDGPQEEAENHDRYLITYSDLITLLLGLFILLYAFSSVDLQKYRKVMQAAGRVFGNYDSSKVSISNMVQGNTIIPKVDPVKKTQEQIQKALEDNQIKNAVQLVQNERGFTLRILDDILFISGKAELTDYSKIILKKVAAVLRPLPNDIRIEGHTDNVPIAGSGFPSNWHLSVARATNTAFYLMDKEGLPPERVTVVGYAEYHPIASNETPAGRTNNRRVDIVILN